jgi:hypothetical protein
MSRREPGEPEGAVGSRGEPRVAAGSRGEPRGAAGSRGEPWGAAGGHGGPRGSRGTKTNFNPIRQQFSNGHFKWPKVILLPFLGSKLKINFLSIFGFVFFSGSEKFFFRNPVSWTASTIWRLCNMLYDQPKKKSKNELLCREVFAVLKKIK